MANLTGQNIKDTYQQLVTLGSGATITNGTGSQITNLAVTASWASNAVTASYALNAEGSGFPYTGSAMISGSLQVDGPILADDIRTTLVQNPSIGDLTLQSAVSGKLNLLTANGTEDVIVSGSIKTNNPLTAPQVTAVDITVSSTASLNRIQAVGSEIFVDDKLVITSGDLNVEAGNINADGNITITSGHALETSLISATGLLEIVAGVASGVNIGIDTRITGSLNVSGPITGTITNATTAATASSTPNALVTASVSSNVITLTKGDGSAINLTVATGSAVSASYAAYAATAGTAATATTASYAILANSANVADTANTAAVATTALTANTATTAGSALTATSASHAIFANTAGTAASATVAGTANNADLLDNLNSTAFAQLAQNNSFTGTQNFVNIAVSGTGSFGYIQSVTGSAKIIGDAFIILNNDTPAERYAGIVVQDSGSTLTTASFQFDGLNNDWFYEYSTDGGVTTDHGVALFGPEYSSKGSPTYPSANVIQKGTGGHHLTGSNITDDDTKVSISIPLEVIGNISTVSGAVIAGSFTGSLNGNADTATSASFATYAATAGTAVSVTSASFATYANTAGTANSASYAPHTQGLVLGNSGDAGSLRSYIDGGASSIASGSDALSIGNNATATGYQAVSLGPASTATDFAATSVGGYAKAEATLAVAVGNGATIRAYGGVGVGASTEAEGGQYAVAIGQAAKAYGDNTIAIGRGAVTAYPEANQIVIGRTTSTGANEILIGSGSTSYGANTIHIGNPSITDTYLEGTIHGDGSGLTGITATSASYAATGGGLIKGTGTNSVRSAPYLTSTPATASGIGSIAIGEQAEALADYSVAIGFNTEVFDSSRLESVAIGKNARTAQYSVSVGGDSDAVGAWSTALGYAANASNNYTVAVGYNSQAQSTGGIAIGSLTNLSGDYSLALGYDANATAAGAIAIGSGSNASGNRHLAIGSAASATGATAMDIRVNGSSIMTATTASQAVTFPGGITGSLSGTASLATQVYNNNTSSGSLGFWQGSQTEYNAISGSASNSIIYFII